MRFVLGCAGAVLGMLALGATGAGAQVPTGNFQWTCVDVLRVTAGPTFSFQCKRDTGEVVVLDVQRGWDQTGAAYAPDKLDLLTTEDTKRASMVATLVTTFFREKTTNPASPIKLQIAGLWSKMEPGKPRAGSVTLQR